MDVLVPFDLTSVSERALEHAVAAYGPREDVTIHAVRVGRSAESAEGAATKFVEELSADAEATVRASFRDADRDRLDDADYVAREILAVTDELAVDAIVVGRHGDGGTIGSLFGRHVADHLLDDGQMPVTVVR